MFEYACYDVDSASLSEASLGCIALQNLDPCGDTIFSCICIYCFATFFWMVLSTKLDGFLSVSTC